MLTRPLPLPVRRADLIIRPIDDQGRCVVKDPQSNSYYKLGEEESFLLTQLDGEQSAESVCAAFARSFGAPLSYDELQEFIEMAHAQKLVALSSTTMPPFSPREIAPTPVPVSATVESLTANKRQSFLAYRIRLWDPDKFFARLAPRLAFIWTKALFTVSFLGILAAAALVWLNRQDLVSAFAGAMHWQTLALVWLTLVAVTLAHECAHGLTCKHHGGEVHEIGFLLLFLMPCFYCNVSDAWLFRERSKRLWVTLAGGYCDLCLWAVTVFVWRLAAPESLLNYVAFVVLSVLGARVFLNVNPLIKLDGYYLLGDALEVSNLQSRSWERVKAYLRWLFWGAARPQSEPQSRLLLSYGIASWLFSIAFIALLVGGLLRGLGQSWGVPGVLIAVIFGGLLTRGLLQGLIGGELAKMLVARRRRALVWGSALFVAPAILIFGYVPDKAGGAFQVRSVGRAELRAPVAGFLSAVLFDEGEPVAAGDLVVCLEVTDLNSRAAQKRAEVSEAQAKLRLLEVGPRPVEIVEQRLRVGRAQAWHELSNNDLDRAQKAHADELNRLNGLVTQYEAELANARETLVRARRLSNQGALADQECQQAEKLCLVAQSQRTQAIAQRQVKTTMGTQEAEGEVAKRAKDLADAESILRLLEAGTRPEEIDAERARLARLQEELHHLERLQLKVRVTSPVTGVVTTPRLKERVGQYVREGELIGLIEATDALEAEVALSEHDAARVIVGSHVELKARSMPFRTFAGTVTRVAPAAAGRGESATYPHGDLPVTVNVYCRLAEACSELRPGTTGYARVVRSERAAGVVYGEKLLRYLRTEFWW